MWYKKSMLGALCTFGLFVVVAGAQAEGWYESGKAVKFVGLNWESGTLPTELMQSVLVKGYDCITDSLSGNSITMGQALSTSNIQVFAKEWIGRSDTQNKAVAAGEVVDVGEPVVGAVEGWYMPRHVIEGDPQHKLKAKAPKLHSIADLVQYAKIFRDPEEPGKKRFCNRPAGWICELENSETLKSYGPEETFTNLHPGTGPALGAVVLSSYWHGESILFYYWLLAPLMGRTDLMRLEERPGVDKRIRIQVGLSQAFHNQTPEPVAVLGKVNLLTELLNSDLMRMAKDKVDAACLAREFLEEHPEAWHVWVDEDAAKKIETVL